jgi:hypothetical protein
MMTSKELIALADEIERRGLKFADVIEGRYEMPSEEEHEAICMALRQYSFGPKNDPNIPS